MIIDAVRKKDIGTLQALLLSDKTSASAGSGNNSGSAISSSGLLSSSPLSSASFYGKSPTQQPGTFPAKTKKKSYSIDPNQRDDLGYTPLLIAVALESMDLVDCLLRHATRLNINLQDLESGYTALHKVSYWSGLLR
jgi:ankyrin repeat protein